MRFFAAGLFITTLFICIFLIVLRIGEPFLILWAVVTLAPFLIGSVVETYKIAIELLEEDK